MLRSYVTHRVFPALTLAVILTVGCSDDDPTGPRRGLTLVPEASSYSLKVGETRTTFVKAVRVPGVGGQVAFSVSAAGTGLNASMMFFSAADSARIDLSAVAPGS